MPQVVEKHMKKSQRQRGSIPHLWHSWTVVRLQMLLTKDERTETGSPAKRWSCRLDIKNNEQKYAKKLCRAHGYFTTVIILMHNECCNVRTIIEMLVIGTPKIKLVGQNNLNSNAHFLTFLGLWVAVRCYYVVQALFKSFSLYEKTEIASIYHRDVRL